jgi:hypothetical protein
VANARTAPRDLAALLIRKSETAAEQRQVCDPCETLSENTYCKESVLSCGRLHPRGKAPRRANYPTTALTRMGMTGPFGNCCTTTIEAERRRSERLSLDVALVIRGESKENKPFQENTFTISISAHGALLVLATQVALGQTLHLSNPQTQDEVEGRVVRFGSPYGGLAQVGIDFATPVPEFWPVESLPDSWRQLTRGSTFNSN